MFTLFNNTQPGRKTDVMVFPSVEAAKAHIPSVFGNIVFEEVDPEGDGFFIDLATDRGFVLSIELAA